MKHNSNPNAKYAGILAILVIVGILIASCSMSQAGAADLTPCQVNDVKLAKAERKIIDQKAKIMRLRNRLAAR